jgi:hypothetical protein
VAVERCEVLAQLAQIEEAINPAQQVIGRNVIVEIECIEQLPMSATLSSHHSRFPRTNSWLQHSHQALTFKGFFKCAGKTGKE